MLFMSQIALFLSGLGFLASSVCTDIWQNQHPEYRWASFVRGAGETQGRVFIDSGGAPGLAELGSHPFRAL